MLKRGKRSISGKAIGPHGSQIKRIKPQLTRRIIRRYHFLLQRKQILLKWLKVQDVSLEKDDAKVVELFKNDSNFQKGWDTRGDDMKIKDSQIEDQLVRLQQQLKDRDQSDYCFYLGYIMKEIRDEGGINTYQEASRMGQDVNRGGDSSKVLVQWLKEIEYKEGEGATALEIGSLSKRNAISTSGIFNPVVRIDLNNYNDEDGIIKQDFMERPLPKTPDECFNLISCSLVLNFVPTPKARGEMCQRFTKFMKPDRTTYLFVVLPLPCINNSRYMTLDHFTDMFTSLGYERIKYHEAKKVCYFLFSKTPGSPPVKTTRDYARRYKLRDGPGMNNFSITL